eukprot:3052146-Prorocentrum_lima.AAC.1
MTSSLVGSEMCIRDRPMRGECHINAWRMPYRCVANATSMRGECHITAWRMPYQCVADAISMRREFNINSW